MSNIIRFDLKDLEKLNTPFANYILGRSYDLEENGATQDYKKALQISSTSRPQSGPLICTVT